MMKKEFAEMNLTDHAGVRLTHGKPKVNGVEIHYAIGGAGEPVFLLHGVPKTMSYWRHVVPLLTPHYTVIAVDNRGFGGSQRPLTGYDTATMGGDVAELATHLGFDQFRVVGEDWGAAIAYAVAAFHRPRVQQLVFQETLLPGLPVGDAHASGDHQRRPAGLPASVTSSHRRSPRNPGIAAERARDEPGLELVLWRVRRARRRAWARFGVLLGGGLSAVGVRIVLAEAAFFTRTRPGRRRRGRLHGMPLAGATALVTAGVKEM
jgi:pimeloyl-ACP methyl ester carboxylesterase